MIEYQTTMERKKILLYTMVGMDFKNNIDQKHMFYDSLFIKFKEGKHYSRVTEANRVVTFGGGRC